MTGGVLKESMTQQNQCPRHRSNFIDFMQTIFSRIFVSVKISQSQFCVKLRKYVYFSTIYFLYLILSLDKQMKIIIKNGDAVEVYRDASDVSVLPKSKLVRTFNEDGSLIDEFKLVDKKITLDDDLDKDQTEIVVTLDVRK